MSDTVTIHFVSNGNCRSFGCRTATPFAHEFPLGEPPPGAQSLMLRVCGTCDRLVDVPIVSEE